MMQRLAIKRLSNIFLLTGIYAYLFYWLQQTDFSLLKKVSPSSLLQGTSIFFLIMFLNLFFEIKKWQNALPKPLSFSQASCSVLRGILFGLITPNRLGEYYGRKLTNFTWREIMFSVFISRTAQSVPTFFFGVPALFFFLRELQTSLSFPEIHFSVSLLFVLAILLPFLLLFHKKIFTFFHYVRKEVHKLFIYVKSVRFSVILLYTFLRYLVFVFGWIAFLFWITDSPISWQVLFGATATIFLLKTFVPVTLFSGLGVREFFAVLILSELGFSIEEIFFVSFAMFFATHLFPSLIAIIILSIKNGKKLLV